MCKVNKSKIFNSNTAIFMHSQQYFSKFWSWPVVINTSSVVIGHANKRMHITETSDWILTIIYLKKKKDSTFTALYISTFMCFYFHIVQKFYFTWLNRLAYFNCQLTLFFFFFFLAMSCSTWDLSSLTRASTCAPCTGSMESLTHWTTREVPD